MIEKRKDTLENAPRSNTLCLMINGGRVDVLKHGVMLYGRCGRVINVTIGRDMQGMSRGFAHVEFSNELEAHNALLLSGGWSPICKLILVIVPAPMLLLNTS